VVQKIIANNNTRNGQVLGTLTVEDVLNGALVSEEVYLMAA